MAILKFGRGFTARGRRSTQFRDERGPPASQAKSERLAPARATAAGAWAWNKGHRLHTPDDRQTPRYLLAYSPPCPEIAGHRGDRSPRFPESRRACASRPWRPPSENVPPDRATF